MIGFSRRKFLKLGAAAGFGLTISPLHAFGPSAREDRFHFGLVADLHYADKDPRNNRYYRQTLDKLYDSISSFNDYNLPFAVVLGDLVDSAPDREAEQKNLAAVNEILSDFRGEIFFVLGNHDLARLSKARFLRECGASELGAYFSFNRSGFHFIVLDANYRTDGEPYDSGNFTWKDTAIPESQLEWLSQDLSKSDRRSVVFVHQNLNDETSRYGVKNAKQVREVLERSEKVIAVFQGHQHKGGRDVVNGIPYVTLKALVDGSGAENNSFAVVSVGRDQDLNVKGFGKQEDIVLDRAQE